MLRALFLFVLSAAWISAANPTAVVDGINYNAGATVSIRISPAAATTAVVRYAGDSSPVARAKIAATESYQPLWTIPPNARTGRYEVDLDGMPAATSFAVHRKLARIAAVDLDRTFYTNGDPIHARITVQNLSSEPLPGIRVEFSPAHYPWIAPGPDETVYKPAVVAESLALAPGESKALPETKVATAFGGDQPAVTGYVTVLWDQSREHILDIAFTPPIFLRPPNTEYPKRYPFLYLYPSLADIEKRAMAYRHFYPPAFVSDVVQFDTSHTIFPTGSTPEFRYTLKLPEGADWPQYRVRSRVLQNPLKEGRDEGPFAPGDHRTTAPPMRPGRYTLEISVLSPAGVVAASNRLEFAIDDLPKSIFVLGAHQDDDTAHPALIRAAVENHIPIHFVYETSGDAGGCDRYYQQSCDASRAMDFGETRMAETRASLGHLGVPAEDIFFLGLPDGGLEEIWLNHHGAAHPYLSVLLASDHAPYSGLVQPNLPFSRDAIVDVVAGFIRKYQPDVIVAGHPEERHVDHRTNGWIAIRAMQQLLREGAIPKSTRLLVDKSYGETSWIHSPYNYRPFEFFVPGEVARIGQEALWFYQSQDGNHQQGAMSTYDQLPRTEAYPHLWITDWDKHEGWNEKDLRPR